MRISDWSSDVCSSDLAAGNRTAIGTLAAMRAYAEGVNAFLDHATALPPEYTALELTQVRPWQVIDSINIGKLIAFGLSFDLEDISNSQRLGAFQSVLGAQAGAALFFEELFRSQPFDPAATVPDSGGDGSLKPPRGKGPHAQARHALSTPGPARDVPPVGDAVREQLGRAECREKVGQSVKI